jgi:hypothetical protein
MIAVIWVSLDYFSLELLSPLSDKAPSSSHRGKNCTPTQRLCAAFAESGHAPLHYVAAREIKITYISASIKARGWWNIFSWKRRRRRIRSSPALFDNRKAFTSLALSRIGLSLYIVARTSLFKRDECRVNGLARAVCMMQWPNHVSHRRLFDKRASLKRWLSRYFRPLLWKQWCRSSFCTTTYTVDLRELQYQISARN